MTELMRNGQPEIECDGVFILDTGHLPKRCQRTFIGDLEDADKVGWIPAGGYRGATAWLCANCHQRLRFLTELANVESSMS